MFGFGKKKIQKSEKFTSEIKVIPDEFYGAKDPVINYGTNKNKFEQRKQSASASDFDGGGFWSRIIKNKKILYTLVVVIFIGIIAIISWYYINQANKQLAPQVDNVPVENNLNLPAEEAEADVIANPTEEAVENIPEENEPVETDILTVENIVEEDLPVVEEQPKQIYWEFPSIFLVDSSDVDNDDLTDAEEEVFNTDSGTWDTDTDGYYDGQEVSNLYNPTGLAPVKLIDAGLIQEYVNPTWQYRVYYPLQWLMGEVDSLSNQVLFSSAPGDFVEIAVLEKDSAVTFATWFGANAKGQNFSDLQKFTNRFQEEGWKRKDNLVAYFVNNNKVYVLVYNSASGGPVLYRHVIQMMMQSFRPNKTLVTIPDQVALPAFPDFTNQTAEIPIEDLLVPGEFEDTEEIL